MTVVEEIRASFARLWKGEIQTAAEWKREFEAAHAKKDALAEELSHWNVEGLKKRFVYWGNGKKADRVRSAVDGLIAAFAIDGYSYTMTVYNDPVKMEQERETAIRNAIDALTDDKLKELVEKRRAEKEEFRKALDNPETLEEFETFIRCRGEEKLTSEQKIRYDELKAEKTRGQREEANAKSAIVESVDIGDVEWTLRETVHTKKNIPLFVVQLGGRVAREAYLELNQKARMLGGRYSTFGKGFQFATRENAEQFMALRNGSVDRSEILEARSEKATGNSASRLTALADRMEQRAKETLNADRQVNTRRRANIAEGIEARARGEIAMASTIRNLAAAIREGRAQHLNGIKAATHVETLDSVLRGSMSRRNIADNFPYAEARSRTADQRDTEFVEMPWPSINPLDLQEAISTLSGKDGFKLTVGRLQKILDAANGQEWVKVAHPDDIATLEKAVEGLTTVDKGKWSTGGRIASRFEDYKRVVAMGIEEDHELRAAVREYLLFREGARDEDPIRKLERGMIGCNIPGYFPTPIDECERIVELLEIEDGMTVLEPSAGKGDIADAVRRNHPGAALSVIEINSALRDILKAKGHQLVDHDFMQHKGRYDRIVMNPPFENFQDITHVRHAFECLNPGGRLVAIMSAGPFFRQDKKAVEFRDWLDQYGIHEKMEAGTFLDSDRPTGVATERVVMDKPGVPEPVVEAEAWTGEGARQLSFAI